MVKLEFDSLWSKAQQTKDTDPEYKGKTDEEIKEELQKMSERRVRLGIILAETGREEKVDINEQDIREAVFKQATQFPGQEQVVIQYYEKNPQAVEELKGPILEDKVVELVLEKADKSIKNVEGEDIVSYFEENSKNQDAA